MKTVEELLTGGLLLPITLKLEDGSEVSGLLSEYRVDKKNELCDKHLYDIRHTDEDWCEPATLEKNVVVNWFGTLIVDEPIQALEGTDRVYKEIVDWGYDDE